MDSDKKPATIAGRSVGRAVTGERPWAACWKMFARASFIPTLAYNVLMQRLSSRRWWDRVDDTVILGALPFRHMTKQVRAVMTYCDFVDHMLPMCDSV